MSASFLVYGTLASTWESLVSGKRLRWRADLPRSQMLQGLNVVLYNKLHTRLAHGRWASALDPSLCIAIGHNDWTKAHCQPVKIRNFRTPADSIYFVRSSLTTYALSLHYQPRGHDRKLIQSQKCLRCCTLHPTLHPIQLFYRTCMRVLIHPQKILDETDNRHANQSMSTIDIPNSTHSTFQFGLNIVLLPVWTCPWRTSHPWLGVHSVLP